MMKESIGIIGSGMIASSLAVLTTGNGYPTKVLVRSEKSRNRFLDNVKKHWDKLVGHGEATLEQVKICGTYLTVTEDYADLRDVRQFFEAVTEDPLVKQSVYKELAKACPDVSFIASCTSALTPQMLTDGLDEKTYADRIVVAHPFNPVHMVPYVELCGCEKTGPGVIGLVVKVLEDLGRKPVVLKKATPGFIGNRLQFALFREAMALVEQGICDYRDIDTALNYSFCPRYTSIGIFEHFDAAGLDLDARNSALLFPLLSNAKETPAAILEKLESGKGGLKDGEGFYDWRNVDMEAYTNRVNEPYWKFCRYQFPTEPLG
ncbi:MAG: 3-hydroxyacyl-CoA dehydrogenase family protein [Lachnospiraceae bacterium]|nr:3-hydroxyacyl-CoA dehydrogenase family protein [Lachnospiraceae bacterium]